MKAILASAAPGAGARAARPLSHGLVVEALVTIAVVAWLAVSLAAMVGEWRGGAPEAGLQTETSMPRLI